MRHVFGDRERTRIEIRCAAGDLRSRAPPERLGFRLQGTVGEAGWLYDRFVDHVAYGRFRTEWGARD